MKFNKKKCKLLHPGQGLWKIPNSKWAPDNSSTWEGRRTTNQPIQHYPISVLSGFYIQITTGCSNYERSHIWEALLWHGCTTWSFTQICTAPVTFTASTTEALTSWKQRTMAIKCIVLKNSNLKSTFHSLSHIHRDCKYFYNYITPNTPGQIH